MRGRRSASGPPHSRLQRATNPSGAVYLLRDARNHVYCLPPSDPLPVGVDALDQGAKLSVAALGYADPHRVDSFGRGKACLTLGLGRDRVLDSRLGFLVERLLVDGHTG